MAFRECRFPSTSLKQPGKDCDLSGGIHMDDIESRVVELVAEVLVDVNKENIQLSSKIVDDLGAESLDIYDMIALLEDEFGMEITDEQVEKIQTVQDVADFIRQQKAS
jgi:acyl carrier protein